MRLKELNIIRYGPVRDRRLTFEESVNLIYGPNESGKTLSIDALIKLLLGRERIQRWDIDRVESKPNGYAIIEIGGEEIELTGSKSLIDVIEMDDTELAVDDLRNVFIIRDSDLRTHDSPRYFETLVDRVSGARLAEIEKIIEELEREGRITPKGQLTDRQDTGKLATRVRDARKLLNAIEEFFQRPETHEYEELEWEFVRKKTRLEILKQHWERLEQAKELYEAVEIRNSISVIEGLLKERQRYDRSQISNLRTKAEQARAECEFIEASKEKIEFLSRTVLVFAFLSMIALVLAVLVNPLALAGLVVFAVLTTLHVGRILSIKDDEAKFRSKAHTLLMEARAVGIKCDDVDALCEKLRSVLDRADEVHNKLIGHWSVLADKFNLPMDANPEDHLPSIRNDIEMRLMAHKGIDADNFDSEEYERVRQEMRELGEEIEGYEKKLEYYRDKLQEFERTTNHVLRADFSGSDGGLEIGSLEALRAARSKLEEFIDRVETRADTAREAIKILKEVRNEERSSIGNLFKPDGPATRTFARITKGAYSEVLVNRDGSAIHVRRAGGELIPLEKLSRGATDQLYLSVRITLAKEILGEEPGFFVMDDPFLASDMGRLREQVSILKELAQEGWQIIYFTSKEEVVTAFREMVGVKAKSLNTLQGLIPPEEVSQAEP